ncbi:hypothetical protein HanXRQr2_Chr03g0090561 [Helianthus annuus]|uniref:Uncharacterized protein n=1 Tax=Helianthus annuus TaxID=4232 RepID=A0A9K3JE79_HELAN|nr:hypothetical protein HanXRQr2_Chr03g0090561 [Helianthus annuus]
MFFTYNPCCSQNGPIAKSEPNRFPFEVFGKSYCVFVYCYCCIHSAVCVAVVLLAGTIRVGKESCFMMTRFNKSLASCCQKMNFFCRSMADESAPSQHDIVRCPFLRNINEPTNFSFSLSMAFPLPARGTKGPIFEDGPNFDMAFRLFHGQNGVVSLSKGTLQFPQKVKPEQVSQQFNPLAAKAATISLSSLGGSFGFDAFNEMFKNHQKKNKKKSSQKGDSNHEATGEEWLKSGNCPIAKSYRVLCWLSSSASTSCRCLIPLKASLFFE